MEYDLLCMGKYLKILIYINYSYSSYKHLNILNSWLDFPSSHLCTIHIIGRLLRYQHFHICFNK